MERYTVTPDCKVSPITVVDGLHERISKVTSLYSDSGEIHVPWNMRAAFELALVAVTLDFAIESARATLDIAGGQK